MHAVETMGFRIGSQLAERCGQLSAPRCAAQWPSGDAQLRTPHGKVLVQAGRHFCYYSTRYTQGKPKAHSVRQNRKRCLTVLSLPQAHGGRGLHVGAAGQDALHLPPVLVRPLWSPRWRPQNKPQGAHRPKRARLTRNDAFQHSGPAVLPVPSARAQSWAGSHCATKLRQVLTLHRETYLRPQERINAVQGRFVLEESSMAWLLPLRPAASETPAALQAASAAARARAAARKKIADLYVALASSCIRGALSHLNLACSVVGNCSAAPTCAVPSLACVASVRLGAVCCTV